MLELILNGEVRPSRILKLTILITPFFFLLVVLAFVSFAKWKDRKKNNRSRIYENSHDGQP